MLLMPIRRGMTSSRGFQRAGECVWGWEKGQAKGLVEQPCSDDSPEALGRLGLLSRSACRHCFSRGGDKRNGDESVTWLTGYKKEQNKTQNPWFDLFKLRVLLCSLLSLWLKSQRQLRLLPLYNWETHSIMKTDSLISSITTVLSIETYTAREFHSSNKASFL